MFDVAHFLFVALALDGLAFDFFLGYAPGYVVESLRHRVDFQFQLRCSLVDKVDGLVGKETVGDVALRQLYGGDNRFVADTHFVMVFVAFFQSAQNRYGTCFVRFVDHHFLESAFERLVLLEVFLVLVKCCSAYAAQFAAGEGRLENVGGVHGAFSFTRAYKGVDFVDKEYYFAVGLCHFVHDGFQSFLEFAFVFGAGDECAHVERIDLLAAQVFGHVAAYDAVCESFGDGSFAGTRFAY